MYHLIGDIHGHATTLKQLLLRLGYTATAGYYRHPTHTAIFVGDYIDRGPDIVRTLDMVKAMVDGGAAIALMGNHEFNAICFNTPVAGGGYLRSHAIKNFKQHAETLLQFQNRQGEYDDYVAWFKTLPLYFETEALRVVHASWHARSIDHLRTVLDNGRLTAVELKEMEDPASPTLDAVEKVLKGLELPLPKGHSFRDKDGQERQHLRYRWWVNPEGCSYEDLSISSNPDLAHLHYPAEGELAYYRTEEKPVFCGHYWLRGQPVLQKENVCCLDYSVAKEGKLVAYRFEGERRLLQEGLVWC